MKRIVIITGASAGIGNATAKYFAEKGDKVYSFARRKAEGFDSVEVDVTNFDAVKRAVDYVVEKEGRIDVVVNNAGYGISGSIEDTPVESMKRLFDVNFFGATYVAQAVIPQMRKQKSGVIINVSSVAAPLSIPFQGFYSASKAALSSLTESLRIEVAPFNIKVTSILPGDVKTDFTAMRKKNEEDNPVYGERISRSVAQMEKDEQNGMPPIVIAKGVYSLSKKKNPPVYKVGGKKYAILVALSKILPKRLVIFILSKLYG